MSDGLVLITGGGTGIGLGTARAFVEAGRPVIISGRRPDVLEAAVADLGPLAKAIVHDVDTVDGAADFLAAIEREHGPLTALVNNAGRHHKAPAMDHPVPEFAAVLHTNVVAPFALSQAAARLMAPRGGGSIVMISSMTATIGIPLVPAYAASKASIAGLGLALANEWGPHNIRVNVVCPGFIDSAMFRKATSTDPARLAKITGRIALPRLGDPMDIGRTIRFLCSDEASYITGEVMAVDGGFSTGF